MKFDDDEIDFSEVGLDDLDDIGIRSGFEYFDSEDGEPQELDFDD